MTPGPGPPPPPPPPPAPSLKNGNNEGLEVGQTETKLVTEEEFVKEVEELVRRNGGLLRRDGDDKVILVVAVLLQTVILQNGPMCGIVALAEALELLKNQKKTENSTEICPKAMLDEAVRKGYTKQGEMFSVRVMQQLAVQFGARQNLSKIEDVSKNELEEGMLESFNGFFEKTVLHLISGYPVLFPYDADHNHTPSLRKGHAAHWAVVHGLACSVPYLQLSSIIHLDEPSTFSSSPFQVLQSSRDLVILKPTVPTTADNNNSAYDHETTVNQIAKLFAGDKTLVVGHQGKSFRTALWSYKDLMESNRNLNEIAPKIMAEKDTFILHEGIQDGLCSKILLLK